MFAPREQMSFDRHEIEMIIKLFYVLQYCHCVSYLLGEWTLEEAIAKAKNG
jgi:hypothetical protein